MRVRKHQSLNLTQPPEDSPEQKARPVTEPIADPDPIHRDPHPVEAQHSEYEASGSFADSSLRDQEIDRLTAERNDIRDQFLRSQAEFQNYRKRVERERQEFTEYASTEAVRSLLPILDDFERGLKVEGGNPEYVKGMELIYSRLYDALKRLGLEPVDSTGTAFDPHVHHAVEMVETDDAPDQTVLAVYQRGYNFKGRLLRAAMVKVAVAPTGR